MKTILNRQIFALMILLSCLYGCDKIKNFDRRAPENRVTDYWTLLSAYKDGTSIYTYGGATANGDYFHVIFYSNGEINIRDSLLNSDGCAYTQGVWQMTEHKKNIEITLMGSCFYTAQNIVPIKRTFNWKILELRYNKMQVEEKRSDGVYEFNFKVGKN